MATKLADVPDADLASFEGVVKPLIRHIRRTWRGTLAPIGYTAAKASGNYEDLPLFDRHSSQVIDDAIGCGFSFAETCDLRNTMISDVDQGRSPVETLISAAVAFGMRVERERNLRKVEPAMEKLRATTLACMREYKKDNVDGDAAAVGELFRKLTDASLIAHLDARIS